MGWFITVGGSSIFWKSQKQQVVSRALAETEYRPMAFTGSESIWLKSLFRAFGIDDPSPILLFCDNTAAIISLLIQISTFSHHPPEDRSTRVNVLKSQGTLAGFTVTGSTLCSYMLDGIPGRSCFTLSSIKSLHRSRHHQPSLLVDGLDQQDDNHRNITSYAATRPLIMNLRHSTSVLVNFFRCIRTSGGWVQLPVGSSN